MLQKLSELDRRLSGVTQRRRDLGIELQNHFEEGDMTDGIIRKGFRPDVASFEDKQEAAQIVDFVLIPVYQILNRWIGDPFVKVILPDDFEADEEKFRSFQRLLEELDMSDGDNWSLLSLERLKVVCRDIERLKKQSTDRVQ